MWYFSWILGLLLACSLGVINVLRLEAQEVLEKESLSLDPLTKLLDKTSFIERLRQKMENSKRNGLPFALIFLSLSPVRRAHQAISQSDMDSIMWGVVDSLRNDIREEIDIACRFGFEEFAIVLPGAAEKLALEIAGQMQENIKQNVTIVQNITVDTEVAVAEYPKHVLEMGCEDQSIMEEIENLLMVTCGKLVDQSQQYPLDPVL